MREAERAVDREPRLSVVVPALDEGATIGGLLSDLALLTTPHEIIVADGGSRDETAVVARTWGARTLRTPPGRGRQLRVGASTARAPLLLFVHADVRLGPEAVALLDRLAAAPPAAATAFRLRIRASGIAFRMIEWGANLRSRLLGLPYGDQGLLVRREDYDRADGHPPVPIMEDVALVRALRKVTSVRLLDVPIHVSARRWEVDGPIRRTLENWALLVRYLAGVPPDDLVHDYRGHG